MTRQKFDYESYILISVYEESSREGRSGGKEFKQACQEASQIQYVKWEHGIHTHNPDGSYSPELTQWLKINARAIEISGCALVGDFINVWNPMVKSWEFDGRYFKFSNAYREYLLDEGYLETHIDKEQAVMNGQFESLSCSHTDDYVEERIITYEIPNPARYTPLSGLVSEGRIWNSQESDVNNPKPMNRIDLQEIIDRPDHPLFTDAWDEMHRYDQQELLA